MTKLYLLPKTDGGVAVMRMYPVRRRKGKDVLEISHQGEKLAAQIAAWKKAKWVIEYNDPRDDIAKWTDEMKDQYTGEIIEIEERDLPKYDSKTRDKWRYKDGKLTVAK